MAYNTAYPPRLLASAEDGSTAQWWVYSSTDSLATIMGAGYFSNADVVGIRAGDLILCVGAGKVPTTVMVSGLSSGAASVRPTGTFTPGVGISGGTGTVFYSYQTNEGPILKSSILIDLTGLNSGGTAGDIIGTNGSGVAYLGQITAALHGTIFRGEMTCLETPAGGDTDLDLYMATVATGVEDAAISGLTGQAQLINAGAQSKGTRGNLTAFPSADAYLYLVGQGTANATYTAGIFIFDFWGHGTIA